MRYLELFNQEYIERSPLRGIVIQRDISYLRNIYDHNLNKIQEYYQSKVFATKSNHILNRVIDKLPISQTYNSYDYATLLRDLIPGISRYYNFISEVDRGVIYNGQIFDKGNEEIIILVDEYVNPDIVIKNWKTYPCIKIYDHNVNDINMLLPTTKDYGSRTGIVSMSINIITLGIKYREFIKEQYIRQAQGLTVFNKSHFLYKYVFPTMLPSKIDHVFMNILIDKFYNYEQIVPKYKLQFPIFKPIKQIERWASDTLNVISNKNISFIDILANIQLPYSVNALELLTLTDFAPTSQIKWAMLTSRLKYMSFLVDVCKNKSLNSYHINSWKLFINRTLREYKFTSNFSYDNESIINRYIDNILSS